MYSLTVNKRNLNQTATHPVPSRQDKTRQDCDRRRRRLPRALDPAIPTSSDLARTSSHHARELSPAGPLSPTYTGRGLGTRTRPPRLARQGAPTSHRLSTEVGFGIHGDDVEERVSTLREQDRRRDAGFQDRMVPYVDPPPHPVRLGNKPIARPCLLTDISLVSGFVPFLGYHHVLMILIAVAIILLCKPSTHHSHRRPPPQP